MIIRQIRKTKAERQIVKVLVPSAEIMLMPFVTSKRPQIDASMYFVYKSLFIKNMDINKKNLFYKFFNKSFITSLAIMYPATGGTKEVLPGIFFLFDPSIIFKGINGSSFE